MIKEREITIFACCCIVGRCGLVQCTYKWIQLHCSDIPAKCYGRQNGYVFMVGMAGGVLDGGLREDWCLGRMLAKSLFLVVECMYRYWV